jgi:adenosylcobyric acid synthase
VSARAIFVGGTASNVGKSWMATALCRLLKRRSIRVAPFKAQNMSNNSYPCRAGGEIGRSQVAQAQACGLDPEPAMNPVLLKPCGDSRSQIILHGKVWRTLDARDYYQQVPVLREEALNAFHDLASRFDVIVMEGAGSVAELNLAERDFTNLSIAKRVNARCLLVGDIERGGIFASILGTLDLLAPEDLALIHCFAVNRFRGDRSLFDDGVRILEQRSGLPCLGVFPFAPGIHLDAEDSLATLPSAPPDQSSIAILRFPRISNTTDFRLLPQASWIEQPVSQQFEFVILPGTKSTLADLLWLRETGLDQWIRRQYAAGAQVIGICGGYQMLGDSIEDPAGVDGTPGSNSGLGLIRANTVMNSEKTTLVRQARSTQGTPFEAYEIHMGLTTTDIPSPPFAVLDDGTPEGFQQAGITGTYLHGALESPEIVAEIFGQHLAPPQTDSFDLLADWLEYTATPKVLSGLIGTG